MYIVKRYTVAAFRRELSRALDEADGGVHVVVEPASEKKAAKALIEVDQELVDNGWSWEWTLAVPTRKAPETSWRRNARPAH